jgi:hypothetical protein
MSTKKVVVKDEATWQEPVINIITDATRAGLSPSKGNRYLLSDGANINKICYYDGASWIYLTALEGWIIWNNNNNLYYKFDGSNWSILVHTQGTDLGLDSGGTNPITASQIKNTFNNIIYNLLLAFFKLSVQAGLVVYNLIDGIMDEFEDESGVATKTNAAYDSVNDLYSPTKTETTLLDYMEYANDGVAQAMYVTNSGGSFDSYTKFLSHFDGADEATTYVAETGQTITFLGTSEIDTTNKMFGSGASLLSKAAGDYCTVPDSDDWDLGSGDFTIDFWWRSPNTTADTLYLIAHDSSSTGRGWFTTFQGGSNNRLRFSYTTDGSTQIHKYFSFTPSNDTWYHIEFDRNGNNLYAFVDGIQVGSTADVTGVTIYDPATTSLFIGAIYSGAGDDGVKQFDEIRISKGIARHTSNFSKPTVPYLPTNYFLQSYSEGTIKTQGSYSLKGIAEITDSLNKTLTRTIGSPIDLTGINQIKFDIRSNRIGANIKIGIHDSGGTTSEKTYTIIDADTWETVTWDISGVSDANKDAIDKIIITIINADAANTFYIDNMFAGESITNNMTLISTTTTAVATPTKSRIVLFEEDVDSITLNTDLKAYMSRDGGTTYTQHTLVNEGNYDTSKRILASESIDISGQPSGTSMKWKVESLNNKDLKLHGVGNNWGD